jgi:hypothetical protein
VHTIDEPEGKVGLVHDMVVSVDALVMISAASPELPRLYELPE